MRKMWSTVLTAAVIPAVLFFAACTQPTGGDPALTGTVSITGIAKVGQTLTADTGSLEGDGEISYQWLRGDTDIPGTNSKTYTPIEADFEQTLKVQVSRAGYTGTVTSDPTAAVAAADAPDLTGTVSITGTAKVGETLTADTSALDGEGDISYQWLQGDTVIPDATGEAYTPVNDDVGQKLKVRVSRAGYAGEITSTETAAVTAAPNLTGTVSITGTAKVGQTLTADTGSLGGDGEISYQWFKNDTEISGANSAAYTPESADENQTLKVRVSRAGYAGTIFSTATIPVAAADAPDLTGTVSITGTAKVGETLTANTSFLEGSGTISYQWFRGETEISGATGASYEVAPANAGQTLKVRVNRAGCAGAIFSAATAAVTLPDLTGTVSIAGTATVWGTLTADTSSLGGDGEISYQWLRGETDISGATDASYTIAAADAGQTLKVRVSRAGYVGEITSDPTGAVGPYVFDTPALHRTMASLTGGTITGSGTSGVFVGNRTVTLSAFSIARYETTYELWKEVYDWAGDHGYTFANAGVEGHGTSGTGTETDEALRKTRPVTTINWRDAIVWCNAYSEMSGKEPVYYTNSGYTTVLRESTNDTGTGTPADSAVMKSDADGYRLPTEAEWEYAARGGNQGDTLQWGYTYAGTSTSLGDYAWYSVNSYNLGSSNAAYGAHPVGTKEPNKATGGLYDMSGNVWEWCWDWYSSTVSTGTETNPPGPGSGSGRVLRGGSWNDVAAGCTVAIRGYYYPYYRILNLGFRVVSP